MWAGAIGEFALGQEFVPIVSVASASGGFCAESLANLQSDRSGAGETILLLRADAGGQIETLASFRADSAFQAEGTRAVRRDSVSCLEIVGAVRSDAAVQAEFLHQFRCDSGLAAEAILSVSKSDAAPTEIDLNVQAFSGAAPLEFLTVVHTDSFFPLNFRLTNPFVRAVVTLQTGSGTVVLQTGVTGVTISAIPDLTSCGE